MNSSATIKASGAPGGPGFDAGSAVIVNPDANALTGVFAETIMEKDHVHHQAVPISTDQPAFALNPFAQILQVGTGPTRGVAAGQHHSARAFSHMQLHVVAGLKLAVHHQKGPFAGPISAAGGQHRARQAGGGET